MLFIIVTWKYFLVLIPVIRCSGCQMFCFTNGCASKVHTLSFSLGGDRWKDISFTSGEYVVEENKIWFPKCFRSFELVGSALI